MRRRRGAEALFDKDERVRRSLAGKEDSNENAKYCALATTGRQIWDQTRRRLEVKPTSVPARD